jgi:hypothetical protein
MCVVSPVKEPPLRGAVALVLCSMGICCCYIYYGLLQERYFSGSNRIGANFALVSQTTTNALVALGWSRVEKLWGKEKPTSVSKLGPIIPYFF